MLPVLPPTPQVPLSMTRDQKDSVCYSAYHAKRFVIKFSRITGVCLAILTCFTASNLDAKEVADLPNDERETQVDKGDNIIGVRNFCVHVLELEKTMKLYREILGFKMVKSSVLRPHKGSGFVVCG